MNDYSNAMPSRPNIPCILYIFSYFKLRIALCNSRPGQSLQRRFPCPLGENLHSIRPLYPSYARMLKGLSISIVLEKEVAPHS